MPVDAGAGREDRPEEQAGNRQSRHVLTREREALLMAAWSARERAHAPYSGYRVGAALLAWDGRVYSGCNVESASYGLTCCAERVALFKALSEGARGFRALAVVAEEAVPYPCGACRQVLFEHAPDLTLYIGAGDSVETTTAAALLPRPFHLKGPFHL